MNKTLRSKLFPYLLIGPGLLLLIVFIVWPILENLINAFFQWDGSRFTEKIFVGFSNYTSLISNKYFLIATKNTFIVALIVVTGTTLVGFITAVLLDKKVKGWQVYRFAFFITVALSSVVVSLLWFVIYDPTRGPLNNFLELLNLGFLKRAWIGDPKIAIISISVIAVWQYSGLSMVWFLAGIKTIPTDIYDAARIDGANHLRYVLNIMIPSSIPESSASFTTSGVSQFSTRFIAASPVVVTNALACETSCPRAPGAK